MTDSLKKTYLIALFPVVLFAVVWGILQKGISPPLKPLITLPAYFSPIIFVAAVMTALALPILLRILFARKVAGKNKVTTTSFFRFQKQLLLIVMVTPYLGMAALALELQKFYVSATVLISFYAVYYYYPSQRRINFDKRIFRVKAE